MSTEANDILSAAMAYAKRGWSVIPIKPGTKVPAASWRKYQHLRASADMVGKWFDFAAVVERLCAQQDRGPGHD